MRHATAFVSGLFCAASLLASDIYPAAAQESRSPPDTDLVIANVRIIDFAGDVPRIDGQRSVRIRGGRIAEVTASGDLKSAPGSQVVDGTGLTLVPGLVDMHVHIWDEAELGAYLAAGVTTVRNCSGMPFLLEMRERIESGDLAGPRLFTTGPILNGTGPNAQPNHQLVDTPEAARAAVRAHHAAGYRQLKVYSNLSRPAYEAILDEGRALGMTIMGHSPEGVRGPGIPRERPFEISFEELLDDGFVSFEHMETIVWHALYDQLDEAKARTLAKKIAAAKVAVDPTLLAYHNLMRVAETDGAYLDRAGTEMLNPFISEAEQSTYEYWSKQPHEPMREIDDFYGRATRIFHEEGVLLVTGTDAGIFTNVPGESLITELELFVTGGLTPFDALQAATVNAAKVLGEPDSSGRVLPGYRADLVLLEGDPLQDVSVVGRPVGVVRSGIWLDREALAALRHSATETSYERTRANVLGALALQQ